jgi:hypothetical protein
MKHPINIPDIPKEAVVKTLLHCASTLWRPLQKHANQIKATVLDWLWVLHMFRRREKIQHVRVITVKFIRELCHLDSFITGQ